MANVVTLQVAHKKSTAPTAFSKINEIGKEPGLTIWKQVDEDTIERVPVKSQGTFETNKAYVVLWTTFTEDKTAGSLQYHVHSWIGELIKDDQALNNAIEDKALQLETFLSERGPVTTHREVQNHESNAFMSYFRKSALQYQDPVKLSAVGDQTIPTRLFHLKGKRNVRVAQVELSHKSLNSGDVFILDTGDIIYQWNGSEASRMEKGKGLDLTVRLRDERQAKAKVVIIEEKGDEVPGFWTAIGGKGPIASADSAGDDTGAEKTADKLYRVSDASGDIVLTPVNEGEALSTTMLDPNDCFILDCHSEIFVWIGKGSTSQEKSSAISIAESFLAKENRPSWTPITKVIQAGEIALFKDKFKKGSWGEYVETYGDKPAGNVAKTQQQEKVNVDAMHHPERYSVTREELREIVPTAGEGDKSTLSIWYVGHHNIHELPANEYSIFFNGNCYLVLNTITNEQTSQHVLYFWQGRQASTEDKGSSALLASDMAKNLGKGCMLVRAVQDKEPNHFLLHFKGSMLVRKGKRESLGEACDSLFHVRGTNAVNTRAVEVNKSASDLDSNDAFFVVSPALNCVWYGKGSNKEERSYAASIAHKAFPGVTFQTFEEGSEPAEFWSALGGNNAYVTKTRTAVRNVEARLFQCSNASGTFKVVEVPNFSQDDLCDDDVMILDAFNEVFVWVGKGSNELEQRLSMATAIEYVNQSGEQREDNTVYAVHAGYEPKAFTSYFHAWDAAKATEDSYSKKLSTLMDQLGLQFSINSTMDLVKISDSQQAKEQAKKIQDEHTTASPAPVKATTTTPSQPKPAYGGTVEKKTPAYLQKGKEQEKPKTEAIHETDEDRKLASQPQASLEVLKKKPYPDGVDPQHLERHLSTDDFHQQFKMGRAAFEKLPAWKQTNLKKALGLF